MWCRRRASWAVRPPVARETSSTVRCRSSRYEGAAEKRPASVRRSTSGRPRSSVIAPSGPPGWTSARAEKPRRAAAVEARSARWRAASVSDGRARSLGRGGVVWGAQGRVARRGWWRQGAKRARLCEGKVGHGGRGRRWLCWVLRGALGCPSSGRGAGVVGWGGGAGTCGAAGAGASAGGALSCPSSGHGVGVVGWGGAAGVRGAAVGCPNSGRGAGVVWWGGGAGLCRAVGAGSSRKAKGWRASEPR